jgi:hypothetical protein
MHWRGPRSTVRASRRPLRHLHEIRPPNVRPPNVRLTPARSVGGATQLFVIPSPALWQPGGPLARGDTTVANRLFRLAHGEHPPWPPNLFRLISTSGNRPSLGCGGPGPAASPYPGARGRPSPGRGGCSLVGTVLDTARARRAPSRSSGSGPPSSASPPWERTEKGRPCAS